MLTIEPTWQRSTSRPSSLRGSVMVFANLGDATITNTDFTITDLKRTTWYRSTVTGCAFVDARINDTGLDGAVFTDCDFREAQFNKRDNVLGTTVDTVFIRCDLRDTDWTGRDLFRATFIDCKLAGARGLANLADVTIERADLSPEGDGSRIGTAADVLAAQTGRESSDSQPPR
jgi:uncharacterized protein YjbI with pentapeptide repeats